MRAVQVMGTGQLLELQRRLRAAGHDNIRRSMQRRIRRAAEPLRNDLQQTVRNLPVWGQGGAGRGGPSPTTRPLRASVASAIRLSVRTTGDPGARVWVDRAALPRDLRGMPDRLNDGRWRHPVYGNRRRWATQFSRGGWWQRTIDRHEPRMRQQVARVLDDVHDRLT